MKAGQPGRQGGQAGLNGEQDKLKAGHMIEGQVLRVEGDNYFVKGQDGKEVRLHTDQTTQKTGNIRQGDLIEAEVNDQNHALSIRSAK
jgi:ribosomal protein S1